MQSTSRPPLPNIMLTLVERSRFCRRGWAKFKQDGVVVLEVAIDGSGVVIGCKGDREMRGIGRIELPRVNAQNPTGRIQREDWLRERNFSGPAKNTGGCFIHALFQV